MTGECVPAPCSAERSHASMRHRRVSVCARSARSDGRRGAGFIIFLWPASTEQIGIAVLVTVAAMVYVISAKPFANQHIGSLQAAMLSAQVPALPRHLPVRSCCRCSQRSCARMHAGLGTRALSA